MLATQIRRQPITSLPALTRLQTALLKSGVKILDENDVRAYKDEKLLEAKNVKLNRWRVWDALFKRRSVVVKGLTESKRNLLDWRTYDAGGASRGKMFLNDFVAPGMTDATKIPEEVSQICQKIADTGVTVNFEVEQLDADPFMIACSGAERYYVAVWDEAGFIG